MIDAALDCPYDPPTYLCLSARYRFGDLVSRATWHLPLVLYGALDAGRSPTSSDHLEAKKPYPPLQPWLYSEQCRGKAMDHGSREVSFIRILCRALSMRIVDTM